MKIKLFLIATAVISLSLGSAVNAAPVVFLGNGNAYDFVAGTFTYGEAKLAAAGMNFGGTVGHLVTITSAEENAFLVDQFGSLSASQQFAWIGGSDAASEGTWVWEGGPESGIQFSDVGTPTAPFNFTNWGGTDPNNFSDNEHFAVINLGLETFLIEMGEWGDAKNDATSITVGYVVEFETGAIPLPASIILLFPALCALRLRRRR